MTTARDCADALRKFLDHGTYPGCATLRAAIALLEPPPATDETELAHCCKVIDRWCEKNGDPDDMVNVLMHERASVRGVTRASFDHAVASGARIAGELATLRAEHERLRAAARAFLDDVECYDSALSRLELEELVKS